MRTLLLLSATTLVLTGTLLSNKPRPTGNHPISLAAPKPDPNNGGIKLPAGFGALTVVDSLGARARHIVVDNTGTIFVKQDGGRVRSQNIGIMQLRDTNNDGKADDIKGFGNFPGTGIGIYNGYLYASSDTSVYRYRLTNGMIAEGTQPEPIVVGLALQRGHSAKSLAISPDGRLFVNFGAPSNACQEKDRAPGSKGQDPCPLLEEYAGIWQFDANKLNQRKADGKRYATGIRNAVALRWNTTNNTLYALQHGRDNLFQNWGEMYTAEQSAELPSEEFLMVKEGADFGWPYCYYDHFQSKKVLAPEYGGNGTSQGRCEGKEKPIMAFPGHWAPNDVLFYTGSTGAANGFPARYKNGAFICFHGSWNRAPLKQGGYFVAFVPFGNDGRPSGKYEVFAEGFAGVPEMAAPGQSGPNAGKLDLAGPGDAKHRPMGLAQGPDGSLYITDSVKGTVYRVMYTAKR
ncbi:sorbosone dehydrogenase family protein [Nibrella viscosa]|uniref:Sorbosone dehydrogenase family protein n=1 Tax=Nibrella viscosa TaxID=1084524 RepID=A0ABP8KRT5_9BACT